MRNMFEDVDHNLYQKLLADDFAISRPLDPCSPPAPDGTRSTLVYRKEGAEIAPIIMSSSSFLLMRIFIKLYG